MKRAVALIIILTLFACGSQEKKAEKKVEKVALEFRFAETTPAEGLQEMIIDGSGERFYLHDEVLITNDDISFALVVSLQGRSMVELTFTEAGSQKLAQLTQDNIGKRVGMLIDGKLVTAPIIRAPLLEGTAVINGDFSDEEADRIATGIMLK